MARCLAKCLDVVAPLAAFCDHDYVITMIYDEYDKSFTRFGSEEGCPLSTGEFHLALVLWFRGWRFIHEVSARAGVVDARNINISGSEGSIESPKASWC